MSCHLLRYKWEQRDGDGGEGGRVGGGGVAQTRRERAGERSPDREFVEPAAPDLGAWENAEPARTHCLDRAFHRVPGLRVHLGLEPGCSGRRVMVLGHERQGEGAGVVQSLVPGEEGRFLQARRSCTSLCSVSAGQKPPKAGRPGTCFRVNPSALWNVVKSLTLDATLGVPWWPSGFDLDTLVAHVQSLAQDRCACHECGPKIK